MFSGIIEELGEVRRLSRRGRVTLLEVRAAAARADTKTGDSVAVNGVCLTVVDRTPDGLCFEVIPETLASTNLGAVRIAEKVNLERPLKVGERISGHFVTGHVDCTGLIRKKTYVRENLSFEIAVPAQFAAYLLPKGSVAVDGISLTIMEKKPAGFCVYVIPHTCAQTTLGFKGPSARVNVEFDILAKRGVPA